MQRIFCKRLQLSSCVLAAMLSASSVAAVTSTTAAGYFEDANKRFYQDDLQAAIIQLKNALQLDGKHLPSLLLLGEVHLQQGDAAAAEHALREALLYGADASLVSVPLAQAYLKLGEYQRIINELNADALPVTQRVELLAYQAQAQMILGRLDDARYSIDYALSLDPAALTPKLADVTLQLRLGALPQAMEIAQALSTAHPEDARVWNSYASVQHAMGDLNAAITSYGVALMKDPDHIDARVARLGALLDLNQLEQAQEDLVYLKELRPLEPRAAYFRGLVAAKQGDDKAAKEAYDIASEVIAALPQTRVRLDAQLLMTGALSNYALQQFEAVRNYLDIYLRQKSTDIGARKLLADVLLRQQEAEEAIRVLEAIGRRDDPGLLNMLASAYSQTGRHTQAMRMLEEAIALGGSQKIEEQWAKGKLRAGETDAAIKTLERLHQQTPSTQNGFLLLVAYLESNQFKQAVALGQTLVAESPENLTFVNLLGIALMGDGRTEDARLQFERIIQQKADFLPAQINLVKVDMAAQAYPAAEQRLKQLLQLAPDDSQIMLEYARLAAAQGQPGESLKWAEKAQAINTSHYEAAVYLIERYVQSGQLDRATDVARSLNSVLKDHIPALFVLGRVHALKDPAAAQVVYKNIVKIAGFEPSVLYRTARAQLEIGQPQEALYSLDKALQAAPDYYEARVLHTELSVRLGLVTQAQAGIVRLQEQFPQTSVALQLQGDLFMSQGEYGKAQESYVRGLQLKPVNGLIIGLYQSLLAQGRADKAQAALESWLNEYPDDAKVGMALGEFMLYQKQYASAEKTFATLLKRFPEDSQLLNNHAYALQALGNLAQAQAVAAKAYAIAPENPDIADTLGWALVQQGQLEKGLRYLREASVRAGQSPEILYHLAVALHRLERKKEAEVYLDRALSSSEMFNGIEQARALKKSLSKQ